MMINNERITPRRLHFAPETMSESDSYKLLSSAVQPRPIAWVSTVSTDGIRNLAPFSFFTVASRNPLSIAISIGERMGEPGQVKDTLANIRTAKEFVVNIPAAPQVRAVAMSAEPIAPEIDEFNLAAVEAVESRVVRVPSVRDALFALECRLSQEVGVGTDTLVIGRVLGVSCASGLLDDRLHIDTPSAGFLGRLAGPFFSTEFNSVPSPALDGLQP